MLASAIRAFKRDPVGSLTVIVCLAMGIAVSTGAFAAVSAVFLRPLPVRDEENLFVVHMRNPRMLNPEATASATLASYPLFKAWQREAATAGRLAGRIPVTLDLTLSGKVERLQGALVSESYFELLGVSPRIGGSSPDVLSDDPLQCVLAFGTWRTFFGGAEDVVGRSIRLGSRSLRVAAVLPPDFSEWAKPDTFWIPITAARLFLPTQALESSGYLTTEVFGRHETRAPREVTETELNRIMSSVLPEASKAGTVAKVLSLRNRNRSPAKGRTVLLLQVAGALTLLLGLINAGNALTARSLSRIGEHAIRAALGARPSDLAREQLAETAALVLPALVTGALLVRPAIEALKDLSDDEWLPLDWRALLFALSLAILLTLALTLVSISISRRVRIVDLLNGYSTSRGSRLSLRTRRLFIAVQVALAMTIVLLTAALNVSVLRLERTDLGFRVSDTYGVRLRLPRERYDATGLVLAHQQLQQQLSVLPGVTALGLGSTVPFADQILASVWMEDGRRILNSEENPPRLHRVTRKYLQVLDIPVIAGRPFDDTERNVALVSETMARSVWPSREAIGQRLKLDPGDKEWTEIVGVLGDTRYGGARERPRADLYLPSGTQPSYNVGVVFRAGPGFRMASLQGALLAQDPSAVVRSAGRLLDLARLKEAPTLRLRRATLTLGLAALLLVVAGVHAISSLAVRATVRDLGVRLALGASKGVLWRDILKAIAKPTVAGLITGWLLGIATTQMAGYALYEVRPTDALPGLIASTLILLAALGAGVPALVRTARVDPVVILKAQ